MERYFAFLLSFEKLNKKWVLFILITLFLSQQINFNQLRKIIPTTSKVLSQKLKQLEELGLVVKEVLVDKPLRVQYSLSEAGYSFISTLVEFFTESAFTKQKKEA